MLIEFYANSFNCILIGVRDRKPKVKFKLATSFFSKKYTINRSPVEIDCKKIHSEAENLYAFCNPCLSGLCL